jgi:tetratricopeptide (TPR) repeat protein
MTMRFSLLIIIMWSAFCATLLGSQAKVDVPPSSGQDIQSEIRDLEAKVQANPRSAHLHNQLAALYAAIDDFSGFKKEIGTAITLEPKDPINYFQASLVYGRKGLVQEQRAMLKKAIALDSQNPVFWLERARLCQAAGDRARAKHYYLKAKQLLAAAIARGQRSRSNHVPPASKVVGGTYYDSRHNAYSVENLDTSIDKELARLSE